MSAKGPNTAPCGTLTYKESSWTNVFAEVNRKVRLEDQVFYAEKDLIDLVLDLVQRTSMPNIVSCL